MIVFYKSSFRLQDGAHNADQFIFNIVQDEARRFSFFGFADQVDVKLRTMSADGTGRQVEQLTDRGWSEMARSGVLEDRRYSLNDFDSTIFLSGTYSTLIVAKSGWPVAGQTQVNSSVSSLTR